MFTFTYKGSRGIGKGQKSHVGSVTIKTNSVEAARRAALAEMRRLFPTAALNRHIRVSEVTLADGQVA